MIFLFFQKKGAQRVSFFYMADPETVLAQLGGAEPLVEPLYLKENGQSQTSIQHAYRLVSIPACGWIQSDQYDPRTPFRPGAQSWAEHVQDMGVNAILFVMQLMILYMESLECPEVGGGYRCTIDSKSNPELYQQVCVSVARVLLGIGKKHDFKNKQTYTVTDYAVNLEFMHDIAHQKEVLRQKQRKVQKKPKKQQEKKKKKSIPGLGLRSRILSRFDSIGINLTWFRRAEATRQDVMMPTDQEEEEEEEKEEEVEEQEVAGEEIKKTPYVGPDGEVDKIYMTITEIPHQTDSHEIMGMMINFVIMDPSINPGYFFNLVEKNLKQRSMKNKRFHSELFSQYEKHMMSPHPAGNRTTHATYARIVQDIQPDFVRQHHSGNLHHFLTHLDPLKDSPAHIFNLFTPEFAIEFLKKAGGDPFVLGNASNWIDRATGLFKFPQGVRSWIIPRNSCLWYHPEKLGFINTYFPFIDLSSDFLRALCSGTNMRNFLNGASDDIVAKHSKMEQMLSNDIVVLKRALLSQRSLGYETRNELLYANRESEVIYGFVNEHYPAHHIRETLRTVQELKSEHGVRWRNHLEVEDERRIEEYELYSQILNTTQDALTNRFCNIVQLDGHVDGLMISEPLKAMLRWYQGIHQRKLPHMSRPFVCIDPDLDTFGNTMLVQLFIYTRYAKILQPLICLLSEGLFSAYDAFMEELSYHMMIHGRYDVGKTFTAITTLRNFTCIPGTTSEYSLATKAADTTQKHSYDEIVAMDECPNWLVDDDEAKRNPELVNKEKVKMTRGQLVQKTFVFIDLPSGRRLRWSEDITTDHKKACVFVTNLPPDSKKALSSRTYRVIMKQSNMTPAEMKGLVDQLSKSDTKLWLHINQFLSCMSKKLAMVGGILPEVELDLFDEVSVRVIHWLKEHKAIGSDGGPRSLEIVKPYLRQLVYKMAIRYAFDFEWSENYEKKFSLEQLRAIQPFLYVTVSQIWWAWTACASEWINTDVSNVLRAMRIVSRCDWQPEDTPYKVFERDVSNRIQFRTRLNEFHDIGSNSGVSQDDRHILDLNYLVLEGTEDNIAQRVSEHTNPMMTAEQVKGIFKMLSQTQKTPHRNGYTVQPKATCEKWHKYLDDDLTTKRKGGECPKLYLKINENFDDFRAESDIPSLGPDATLPIVDRCDVGKKRLYFMPGMERQFQQELIVEALRYATMCYSFRPGKILLGFTERDNTTRLTVHTADPQDIEACCREMDEQVGFAKQHNGAWKSNNPYAISRSQGIPLNRCGAFSVVDQSIATAAPFAPQPTGDNAWKEKYVEGIKPMSVSQEIIEDLDVESAIRRHLRCGRPLWEDVRTPQWIAQQTGPASLGIDYPWDEIEARRKLEEKWQVANTAIQTKKSNKLFDERSKMSRKDRQALLLRQQQQPRPQNAGAPHGKKPRIGDRGGVRSLLGGDIIN